MSQQQVRLDEATADRLGKLRSMPIDLSGLQRAVRAQIAEAGVVQTRWRSFWAWQQRPMRAIAASIIIFLAVAGAMLYSSGRPAIASVAQIVQLHEDLVSGRVAATSVQTIEEANRVLASESSDAPSLPNVPDDHQMACCMRTIQNKKVACLLLKGESEPVTLTVANAADMHMPAVPSVTHGGAIYYLQAVGSLNMVMEQRQDKWLCLIGRISSDRLIAIAQGLHF